VAGGLRFTQVSAGAGFTCGVTTTNQAYCWGSDRNGQLGNGPGFISSTVPVPVAGGRRFRTVRAGYDHTCGVTPFDVGFCWGKNRFGELGINSTEPSSQVPVRVVGGLQWNRIVAGGHYSCGVTTDQRAYCWGYNGNGRLGDGSFTSQRRPVPVAGGLRFRTVVAGGGGFDDLQNESPTDAHTCGVTPENRGYCWGRVGGNTNNTPQLIPGTRRWQQLVAGYTHRCGVNLAQVAFCWGENSWGQLGNGTTTSSDTPQRVAGGLEFQAVTIGTAGEHTCGLTEDGRVYCWGLNRSGQLGDGTNTNRSRPVEVAAP
jgi:alpha-tubulin suppressor-like RCC1 family protein